ncbi:MAG: OmpA family protein [Treponema sp.]|jgi:outer membrane protein OmpA-like peptidoglycan-associated protein|nr:OmpA family protein [Treponema sp.]
MRKKWIYCFLWSCILFGLSIPGGAEEFAYRYREGDTYRILSTVKEDVYLDYRLSHRSEILNRIAVKVTGAIDGKGRHEAVFQTSERTLGSAGNARSFQWSREYDSVFVRDAMGYIDIEKKYYMPVVRNVPVFPGRDLKPGETWTAEGHEMHDFRDSFGIEEPYRIPFNADYMYLGEREWEGRNYPAFSVSYRILSEMPAVRGRAWPMRIMGASDQIVYWDRETGQAAAYTESFRMIFELSTGRIVEYRGAAEARLLESEDMDKNRVAGRIAEEINNLNIPDASVRVDDEGITISLENVQFQADSAVLLQQEKSKLDRIAEILLHYPERDILIAGHTALAGTAEGRNRLSRERAAAVAEYLIGKKVRGADRVVVRGYGAERPVADNDTEQNRSRNRRVEITILEN